MQQNRTNTAKLTGTAIMAALVIVFDYTLKYAGLKIPFPWYSNLKFDFTGIPIALSLLMYGLPSATTTSLIAGLGIVMRSGDWVAASLKTVAEYSTIIGMTAGLRLGGKLIPGDKFGRISSFLFGIVSRIIFMVIANLIALPNFYGAPISAAYALIPTIIVFNIIQGGITVGLGYFLFDSVKQRLEA